LFKTIPVKKQGKYNLNVQYSGIQIIDITCNFLIIFTVNPKVPLTVLPRQFKIFAQMPKLSSWKV